MRIANIIRWLRRPRVVVGIFVAAVALGLGAGEFLVRLRERNRDDVPSSTPSAFYRHRRLGIALVRNLDYYGWFSVNSQGFRGPEVAIRRPEGELRIMVVGGSTTFDTQVSADSMTWSARLGHWLRVLHPDVPLQVINAGVPGYMVVDNTIRLHTELFAFEPDIIVLYHGHNDVSCALADRAGRRTRQGDRPDAMPTATPWGQWLQHHSELYNKLVARWRATVRRWAGQRIVESSPPPVETSDEPFLCGVQQFERDVKAFLAVARALEIHVIVTPVVHVSGPDITSEPDSTIRRRWWGARPYAEPDSGLTLYRAYTRVLEQVSEREGATFIGTAQFGVQGPSLFARRDPMHFNDEGADRMGRELAQAMSALGIVTGGARSSSR